MTTEQGQNMAPETRLKHDTRNKAKT